MAFVRGGRESSSVDIPLPFVWPFVGSDGGGGGFVSKEAMARWRGVRRVVGS